jgi:uncharacterized protein YodC (DUF2158 family)
MSNEATPDMFPETIQPPRFKQGDVVRLNGARTHMTVGSVMEREVQCLWLTASYEPIYYTFHENCLTLVTS